MKHDSNASGDFFYHMLELSQLDFLEILMQDHIYGENLLDNTDWPILTFVTKFITLRYVKATIIGQY